MRQLLEDKAAQSTLAAVGRQMANYIGAGMIETGGADDILIMSEYAAALRLQVDTDQDVIAQGLGMGKQIANYIGAGMLEPGSADDVTIMSEYVAALRLQMDGNMDAIAQALGIGHQIANYIGAGMLDPYSGQGEGSGSLASTYLGALERQFLAENASIAAGQIGGTIKGSIAAAFMDDTTTPAMALDLLYAIRDQIDTETVAAEAQAVGAAVIGQIHAGWAAGATDLDWIGPLIRAAQEQSGVYQQEAATEATDAAAAAASNRYSVVLPGGF